MASLYKEQRKALIYINNILLNIEKLKEINIASLFLDVQLKFEVSEKFLNKTLIRFEDRGDIIVKGKKIIWSGLE